MIETVLHGDATALPPSAQASGLHRHRAARAAYDIAKAREYFCHVWLRRRDRTASCKTTRRAAHPGPHSTPARSTPSGLTVLKEEAKKAGLDLELNLVDVAPPASGQGDAGEETRGGLVWLGAAVSIRNTGSPSTTTPTSPPPNNLFNVADKELDSLTDAYNVEFDMDKRAALSHPDPAAHLMISPSSCPRSA